MTVKDELAAAQKAMRAIMDAAKKEGREVTEAELTELQRLSEEAAGFKERADRAEKSAALFKSIEGSPEAPEVPSVAARDLGDFAAKSGIFDRWREGSGRRSVSTPTEFKAAGDPFVTGTLGETQYGRVVPLTLRRLTIADLVASGTMSGSTLTYWTQGAVEGAPTTVAEGAAKPLMHFQFSQVVESMSKIAAITKVSEESMDDLPLLQSVIRSQLTTRLQVVEEDQILNGDGVAPNLRGILNRSGIQTYGAVGDPAAGNLDAIYHAITLVATGASQLTPDAVVINPADFEDLRLAKDANDQYFGGGPFMGPYGNGPIPGIIENPPIWGMRTVVTPAIAAGTVLVGAFAQAAQLFRKGGIRIDSTNSDVDDFQKNLVALRAEERLLLAVYYASAFCKVTLGAA